MQFELKRDLLDAHERLPISSEEFEQIQSARETLFELLAIEQKFDLLLRNYANFERAINDTALQHMLFHAQEWSEYMEYIQHANLALMNFLTSCRTYVDHVPQHLNRMFPSPATESLQFKTVISQQYDSMFGYRVMCALRNHAQHNDLPIQGIKLAGSWDDDEGCRHAALPYVMPSRLRENSSFKRPVLSELELLGDQVDVRPLVRENMSAISVAHRKARDLTRSIATSSARHISNVIDGYERRFGDVIGLAAIAHDGDGKMIRKLPLFRDAMKHLQFLQGRTATITNMERHFVSSSFQRNPKNGAGEKK